MALKATLTADEFKTLPEGLRAAYVADGDAYRLDAEVEDVKGLKTALEKTRQEAKEAREKARAIEDRYREVGDPAEAIKAKRELEALHEKKLLDAGQLEEVLQKRTEAMRRDYEAQRASLAKQLDEATKTLTEREARLAEVTIDAGLREAASKAGVRNTAIPDVLLRGRRIWKLQEGRPMPVSDDGTVLYGKEPPKPITMEEWTAALQNEAPHLFEPNIGAGTSPGAGGAARGNGGAIAITREQARNPAAYRTAKTQAEKAGVELRIIE